MKKNKRAAVLLLCLLSLLLCACQSAGAPEQTTTVPVTTAPEESEPAPTGYDSGEVQAALIFCGGTLYVNAADGVADSLPSNFSLVGTVQQEDPETVPSAELNAAHVPVGTEVYAGEGNTSRIYVRYAGLNEYRIFRNAEQTEKWWLPDE